MSNGWRAANSFAAFVDDESESDSEDVDSAGENHSGLDG